MIVDSLPSTPYNQQIGTCGKWGGLVDSWLLDPAYLWMQDRANSVARFQVTVGQAGTNNRTITLPYNFTLNAPGPGYTCGPAKIVKHTIFPTPNGRRINQAIMTWEGRCTYSQFLARKVPTCCVSLSSFYNNTSVPCNICSCGCQNNTSKCVEPHSSSFVPNSDKTYAPLVQCTRHMCPIQISWQLVKENHKQYWLVNLKITNFNNRMNYKDWNLVIQHPNFDNLTQIFRFNNKSVTRYAGTNDTGMLWGIKFYNDILMQAGHLGSVESELLFLKDGSNFTSHKGWAFPQRVYFNGDYCGMPPPRCFFFWLNRVTSPTL